MASNFEMQKDNRIKANNAFNEFMDYYIKADPSFRNIIGSDIVNLMVLKSNTDEEFNNMLKVTFDIIKTMSELSNMDKK
ncbi:MAG: hypothetical protein MJ134_09500 [Lachnospiraceae bacterium]|nr:hypothetical protein [Lachnospiraceae bacterium]